MDKIDAAQLLNQLKQLSEVAEAKTSAVTEKTGEFQNVFKNALDQVNQAEMNSKATTEAFITGDPKVSLADAMIASQKASISFAALTEVRNKLVSAYQDVMNMSV